MKRARAPASAANLGPGFDALALALACYVEVSVEPADRLEVRATRLWSRPPGGRIPPGGTGGHRLAGHDRLCIDGPFGHPRRPAAWARQRRWRWRPRPRPAPPTRSVTGSPSTAIPRTRRLPRFGGLVAATTVAGRPVYRRLALDPGLRFVFVIPDPPLPTAAARAILPRHGAARRRGLQPGPHGPADRRPGRPDRRWSPRRGRTAFTRTPAPPCSPRRRPSWPDCDRPAAPDVVLVGRRAEPPGRVHGRTPRRRGPGRRARCWRPGEWPAEVRLLDADLGGVTVSGPAAK